MSRLTARLLTALTLTAAATIVGGMGTDTPASADGCFTWKGSLRKGSRGSAVTQLQIRLAGYPGYRSNLDIDGEFGAATAAAVRRFQAAYGIPANGVAGPRTLKKINALQDDDCTPVHFSFSELNRCGGWWSGGLVSAARARSNALRLMWQLEALRHALGDRDLNISSGFRSVACNPADGSRFSRHLFGDAADLTGTSSLCRIVRRARHHGFEEILGPGYPGHGDHAHVANDPKRAWSASRCF